MMSGKCSKALEACRQVADAQQRVAEQKVRVAQLERLGCDAEISRDILGQLEDTLRRMKDRRDFVLRAKVNDAA
jgi:hypothetical protein